LPLFGGRTPFPLRFGGGTPRLQRLIESLQIARGPLYSTNPLTAVGVENNALARVLDRDSYGGNERMSSSFLPSKATVLGGHGTLPRWEGIFGIVAAPSTPEPVRRAAVVAAWQRFLANNGDGGLYTYVVLLLGPLFVKIILTTPTNAVTWWPNRPNPTPDPLTPTPWYSTISYVAIQVQQPATYTEAAFLAQLNSATVLLDWLLPSHCTYAWFTVDETASAVGFYLDSYENLLRDAFDV
jgi:hypothetical protein